jgi:hypothetical protein
MGEPDTLQRPGYFACITLCIVNPLDLSETGKIPFSLTLCIQCNDYGFGFNVSHIGVITINDGPTPKIVRDIPLFLENYSHTGIVLIGQSLD